MNSQYFSQLLKLIFSPYGLVGIPLGIILVYQAQRSRFMSWSLFSLVCFFASLSKFRNEFIPEPPALIFPLQQVRDFGRPLTILFLLLTLLLTVSSKPTWRRQLLSSPIKYLIAIHCAILLKTLTSGNIIFAFMAIATFALVVQVIKLGPSRWLVDDNNFLLATQSIALSGLIFIVLNLCQMAVNIHAVTFVHSRFLGTTGNPQQAAILLSAIVPCLLFLIKKVCSKWNKILWMFTLAVGNILLLMTGSRTGMVMAIATLFFFYRDRLKEFLRVGIPIVLTVAILIWITGYDGSVLNVEVASVSSRFVSTDNTRAQAWSTMWRLFVNHPIFGAPLLGDRLGFAESSWLAAGSTLGMVGFAPMLLFGTSCINMMVKLVSLGRICPPYRLHCDMVVSGLACLLAGSFFEAILLGTLSFSVLILLLYLSLGQYLIERLTLYQMMSSLSYRDNLTS